MYTGWYIDTVKEKDRPGNTDTKIYKFVHEDKELLIIRTRLNLTEMVE